MQATGTDEFLVGYPENSSYFANSLSRNPNLKLTCYSPDLTRFSYRK